MCSRSSGKRGSCDRARTQRTDVRALAAISEAVEHRGKTFLHRPEASARLELARRVAGACRQAWRRCRLFLRDQRRRRASRQICSQLIDRGPHVEAQVGGDLLIAAAAAVQLVAGIADQSDQLLLDEVVDVFRLGVVEKLRRCAALSPICSSPCRMQMSSSADRTPAHMQGVGVRAAGRQLVLQQARSNSNDRCQRLERGVERLAEAARPHLHFRSTSDFRLGFGTAAGARTRRQAEDADESGGIFLIVAVAHGERRQVGAVEREVRLAADDRKRFLYRAKA